MSPAFAPQLGALAASLGRRSPRELWKHTEEIARLALEAARRTGATHVLFPFDSLVLAEAAGMALRWEEGEPTLNGRSVVDVGGLDVGQVMTGGRIQQVLEAARYIAREVPLAAHVVSPARLVRQLQGDPQDADALAAAEDVCAAFTRELLEAGAPWLVLLTGGSEDQSTSSLRRLCAHYGAELVVADGDDPRVAILPLSIFERDDPEAVRSHLSADTKLVLTAEAIPPGIALGVLLRQAAVVAR